MVNFLAEVSPVCALLMCQNSWILKKVFFKMLIKWEKLKKGGVNYICNVLKWKFIQHFPYLFKNEETNIYIWWTINFVGTLGIHVHTCICKKMLIGKKYVSFIIILKVTYDTIIYVKL